MINKALAAELVTEGVDHFRATLKPPQSYWKCTQN